MRDCDIRDAVPDDAAAIYELGIDEPGFQVTESFGFYAYDDLVEWLREPGDDILRVAVDDDQLIGFLFCRLVRPRAAILENIAVVEPLRHQGVGLALLRDALRRLQKQRVKSVHGLVRTMNPSLGFFEHAGFELGHPFMWISLSLKRRTDGGDGRAQ